MFILIIFGFYFASKNNLVAHASEVAKTTLLFVSFFVFTQEPKTKSIFVFAVMCFVLLKDKTLAENEGVEGKVRLIFHVTTLYGGNP